MSRPDLHAEPDPRHDGSTTGEVPMTPVLTYPVDAGRAEPGVSVGWTRRAEIRFDTGVDLSDDLFGPADLLGAAFAACLLKNVERFSRLLPFRYEGASVHVELEREDRPPRIARIRYQLRLITDETPHRVELLKRNLVGFGTIYNTLLRACEVTGEVVAAAPAMIPAPTDRRVCSRAGPPPACGRLRGVAATRRTCREVVRAPGLPTTPGPRRRRSRPGPRRARRRVVRETAGPIPVAGRDDSIPRSDAFRVAFRVAE